MFRSYPAVHTFLVTVKCCCPGIPSHQYFCWTCSHPQVSLHISIIVVLVLIPRYPFTSVLLLNLFSSPGILLHQYYCWTCSHSPVSLYISIIVVLVLIPRSPFTSVLLLYLFSSPGIPLHQYYCWICMKYLSLDVKQQISNQS